MPQFSQNKSYVGGKWSCSLRCKRCQKSLVELSYLYMTLYNLGCEVKEKEDDYHKRIVV